MIVCALFCLTPLTATLPQAQAQDTSADRFTNRDLLAQSDHERQIWVNAFMVGTSNAIALRDVDSGRCLARWYSNDHESVFRQIETSMEAYPEHRPAEIIFALARRACPNFIPES